MNKLYILCGIPFSGKSTLAKAIVNKLDCERVDLDEVKFQLYGKDIQDGDLEQKDWDIIYRRMYKAIENLLKQGKTVVHDTGNFTKYERSLVRQIADKLGIKNQTIFVDVPKSIAYKRLLENRKRKARFDVTDKDFESTVKEMKPPTKDENPLVFKANYDVDSWINSKL